MQSREERVKRGRKGSHSPAAEAGETSEGVGSTAAGGGERVIERSTEKRADESTFEANRDHHSQETFRSMDVDHIENNNAGDVASDDMNDGNVIQALAQALSALSLSGESEDVLHSINPFTPELKKYILPTF